MSKVKNVITEKKVTIVDVAKEAGVSIATVSRVFNKNGYPVSPKLKSKVDTAVKKLGYVPDTFAVALKAKHSNMIGYIVSDITNRHFTVIGKMVEKELSHMDINVIVCSTDGDRQKEKTAITRLLASHVDGFIINTVGDNDEWLAKLSEQIPMLLLHRRIYAKNFKGDFVGSDNYNACERMSQYILGKGHKNVALITSDRQISTFHERTQGFLDGMEKGGHPINPENIITESYTEEGGFSAMETLFKNQHDVSVVASMNNQMTIGIYRYLRQNKISVPKDISVVSFGDIREADLFYVQPTYFTQNPEEIGTNVASMLLSRIETSALTPRELIISTQFMEGKSVSKFR